MAVGTGRPTEFGFGPVPGRPCGRRKVAGCLGPGPSAGYPADAGAVKMDAGLPAALDAARCRAGDRPAAAFLRNPRPTSGVQP